MKQLVHIFIILFLFPVFAFTQIQRNTPSVRVEFIDSNYNYQETGFSFSTLNILAQLNWNIGGPYHSASFGAVNLEDGAMLYNRTLRDDTANGGSFNLAFNHYSDNTSSIWAFDYDLDGYYLLDDSLNVILNLYDVGVYPDNHGIAKLQDGRIAYFQDTAQFMQFSSDVISDSTVYESLGHNIVIFDPSDSSKTKIFDWFSSIDSSFVIPEYLYEGDLGGARIDWGHPNSIFEDYDGNLLLSWRHLGVCKMDVNNGNVLWWFGLPDSLGTEHGYNEAICDSGDCILRLQHDFNAIKGMPNHYSLFDNGDSTRDYSRALFIEYDTLSNTVSITKDVHFLRSDFMGSVDVREDGSYLVNVPTVQKMPIDRFPDWMANGQFSDSVRHYIHLLGSEIFYMDAADQMIAKFVTDSLNFVYNAKFLDFSNWPSIACDEDSLIQTSELTNAWWINSSRDSVSSESRLLADGETYHLAFPFGIVNGFSKSFNSSACLQTSLLSAPSTLETFRVYPNPTNNMLYFSAYLKEFKVIDLLGRQHYSGEGDSYSVSTLDPGVYWIEFMDQGKSITKPFIRN